MRDATRRFETETLLNARLPKARVVDIAGVAMGTVCQVRAETEANGNETGAEAPSSPAEARPSGSGPVSVTLR